MPTGEPVIFKECPLDYALGAKSLEFMRLDGAVGANLQPHPRFVDMYGWCALSMFSEHMKNGDLVKYATPKFDRCDHFDVSKNYSELTVSTKLRWSLQMAEAIAVLHNNAGGVFVHNDIWLAQFLVSDDGHNIKINDYNLGKIMHFDQEKGEYCKYQNASDLCFLLVFDLIAMIRLTLMFLIYSWFDAKKGLDYGDVSKRLSLWCVVSQAFLGVLADFVSHTIAADSSCSDVNFFHSPHCHVLVE